GGGGEGGAVGEDDPAGLAGERRDDLVDVGAHSQVVVAVPPEPRQDPRRDRPPLPLPQLRPLLLLPRPPPPPQPHLLLLLKRGPSLLLPLVLLLQVVLLFFLLHPILLHRLLLLLHRDLARACGCVCGSRCLAS
ncbi:Os09g0569151, partial [Oryza sativa Japonica Group]